MLSRSHMTRIGLGIALAAVPATAFAHPGHGLAQGFSGGFVHPLQGLDHLIAAIAVGAMAARMGGRALWALPAAFLTMIALGGFIGMQGGLLPFAETGILLSLAVFGLALLLNWKVPALTAAAVTGPFAAFHGYMHGTEMIAGAQWIAYGSGFMLSTALLLFTGIGFGIWVARVTAQNA